MTLSNSDLFLISRGGTDYSVSFDKVMADIDGLITVGDGEITLTESDGTPVGKFTVNQAGDSTIALPQVVIPESLHPKGFINVEDTAPADPEHGDIYIQHDAVDPVTKTPDASFVGLAGQTVDEGVFVIFGVDDKWHAGGQANPTTVQTDWAETDVTSDAFLKNKPDLQAEVDAKAGDGAINVNAGVGLIATGQNATANQKGDSTRTLAVDLAGGQDGLEIDSGKLKASVATTAAIGSVSIGDGILISGAGEISAEFSPTVADGRYLRTDAAAGAQVVQSTDSTEFKGGVKISGGSSVSVDHGFLFASGFLREVVGSKSITFNNGSSYSMSLDGSSGAKQQHVFTQDLYTLAIKSTTGNGALQIKGDYTNAGTVSHASVWTQGIDYKALANNAQIYGAHIEGPKNSSNASGIESYGVLIENDYTDGFNENYGVCSNLSEGTGTNYNFYAGGNAPNYFKGDITCDGLVNGTFSLRMQTDDPAAFTTTFATDEEGNEVSNSVYNGTTEDLLSVIKDLRSRVTALEAAATSGL